MEAAIAPAAGPSSCAICHGQPPKYTCPRCAIRTCSAPCSRAHKTALQCSGERDKAAYVPLNAYTYGKLMDDYTWLESGRRRVEAWSSGVAAGPASGGTNGEARKDGPARRTKALALQKELERRGIEMEMMSEGMDRRSRNQSSYNPKSRLVQLSVEIFLHPASPGGPADKVASHARKPTPHFLPRIPLQPGSTLRSLLAGLPADTPAPSDPLFLLPVQLAAHLPLPDLGPLASKPPRPRRHFYPPLPGDTALEAALRGTGFLEFPTLEVWEREEWARTLREGEVGIVSVPGADEAEGDEEDGREEVLVAGEKRVRDAGWGKRRAGAGDDAPDGKRVRADVTAPAGDSADAVQGGSDRAAAGVPAVAAPRPAQTLGTLMGAYASDSEAESELEGQQDEEEDGEHDGAGQTA